MTQFLIREFTDSTGHIHTNIEKAQTKLSIVEAESKEQAINKIKSEQND